MQMFIKNKRGQMSPSSVLSLNLLAEIALCSPIASDYILITRKLAGKQCTKTFDIVAPITL
ncbi:hypothetical protein OKW24_001476 [Peribacillus simplex]|nr:hypothetical protein [Peribacillus simplex]